jgi:hypothetical protein
MMRKPSLMTATAIAVGAMGMFAFSAPQAKAEVQKYNLKLLVPGVSWKIINISRKNSGPNNYPQHPAAS